jgi:hypothetical protein
VQVRGCAWKDPFFGHIEITGPSGIVRNSLTGQWYTTTNYCTGNDKMFVTSVPPIRGEYCAIGWVRSQTGWVQWGRACEWVE